MAVAGLSGCISSSSPKDPPKAIVCTPESPNVNIYKTMPQTLTTSIFQHAAATPIPPNTTPQEQQILEARYAALQYLTYETKRWSDVETIKLDDTGEAQIVITFLSPELIQAVFLNEVLEHRLLLYDFENQAQTVFNIIAERDELLFLVTVTTTNNNITTTIPHIIDIPIKQMTMMNAEDLPVSPRHDDHTLDQPINSSFEPVSGYLAYPLAIMSGNACEWILNPKFNTSIVITVPSIEQDGSNNGPYTWTIPYLPLVNANIPSPTPEFAMPSEFDPSKQVISIPPKPVANLSTANEADQTTYWQGLARFIWNQMTLGKY